MNSWIWLVIVVFISIIGLFFTLAAVDGIRSMILRRSRINYRKSDFLKHFDELGISESLSDLVYREIINPKLIKFPLMPKDNLYEVHGLEGEELNELIVEIAQKNRRSIPPDEVFYGPKISTIEDLVMFIQTFPLDS